MGTGSFWLSLALALASRRDAAPSAPISRHLVGAYATISRDPGSILSGEVAEGRGKVKFEGGLPMTTFWRTEVRR